MLGFAFAIGAYNRQPSFTIFAVIPEKVYFTALPAGDLQRKPAMAAFLPALLYRSHAFGTSQWSQRVHLSADGTDGGIRWNQLVTVTARMFITGHRTLPSSPAVYYPI